MDPASLHAQTSEQAPRFSVVVPAYNAEATIALTMQSVLSQSCGDFELLVVDDGSTDRTLEVVGELAEKDPRVRVLSKPNGGCASARNFGARAARGKFLGLLDSDDSYLSGYLETQDDAIRRHPEADIFSCNGIRRFENGREELLFKGSRFSRERSFTLAEMIEADLVFVMAVFRRDLFERLGGFREDLRYTEDYDFWLRAFASGARHVFTPQPLGVHVRSATSKSSNVEAHASVVRRVLQDLSASSQLNGNEQRAMVRALHAVDMRIERVRLERRIKGGDFAGARRTYYRTKAAYISSRKYWAGLCVITLSPRLYASLISGR